MNGKNLKYFVMGAAIVAAGLGAFAITLPATFTSGEVLSAAKLNQYFAAIKAAIDVLEADGSVTTAKIAGGAVNKDKIADEPGFNRNYSFPGGAVAVPTTSGAITNVTLDAPEAGFVVVTATFQFSTAHTNGTKDIATFKLSKTAGDVDATTEPTVGVEVPPSYPTTGAQETQVPATIMNTFTVVKGANTIHFNGVANRSGILVSKVHITAVYVPTRYGAGSPPVN